MGTQADGPVVRASVANAFGVDQRSSTGYALELGGQLTDSTRVAGRFTYAGRTPELSGTSFALARSGVITAPPMLEITHPSRELKLGAVGGVMPELGGQFLTGLGVTGRIRHRAWDARAHSLAPPALSQQFALLARNPGHLAGAEVGYTTRVARTALFGSSLSDPFTRRALSAVGLRTAIGSAATHTDGMLSGRVRCARPACPGRDAGLCTRQQRIHCLGIANTGPSPWHFRRRLVAERRQRRAWRSRIAGVVLHPHRVAWPTGVVHLRGTRHALQRRDR
jgi:hypothetical protein